MRKLIHSVRWPSCSSEGKRCASPAGVRPASETSLGIDGTKGTWGKRNAQNELLRGLGRSLWRVSGENEGDCCEANLLGRNEPFSQCI